MKVTHEFVTHIPEHLENHVLYISMEFRVAIHKCCCGCGERIVTHLSPSGWKLIFDGKTVSLEPSIGNWSYKCRSHYWITSNEVEWAGQWSEERIQQGRQQKEQNGRSEKSKRSWFKRIFS
jgi:hypothetical protein